MSENDDGPGPVYLRGERVTLRPFEESDIAFERPNINDPDVRRLFRSVTPQNRKQAEDFFEEVNERDAHSFTICHDGEGPSPSGSAAEPHDDERVGGIFLGRPEHDTGIAWCGAWIAPEHEGEGYATDAARTLVRYAFEELRLDKVRTEAFEPNEASQRVLEKAGFEREGVFRDQVYVDGERVDSHRFGILRREWEAAATDGSEASE